MPNLITGKVDILVNGKPLLNKAGAVAGGIGISGEDSFERVEVMGDGGIHGFVENTVVAYCDVTVTDRADVSLSDLAEVYEDGTLIFRARNGGKSYTMEEATHAGNMSVTAGEGETTMRFIAKKWTEDTQ